MHQNSASSLNVRSDWMRCLSRIRVAEPASLALWKSERQQAVVSAGVRSNYEWSWRGIADGNRCGAK